MRSSVCSKHRGWKRLYSTNLSRDEQIRRGKELELYIASEVVASVAQAGEVGAQEPEHTGSM